MAWPTATDVKNQFDKLNQTSFDTYKIPQARLWAISIIKSMLARCYSASTMSGWDTSTPDLLTGIFYLLVYGWFAPRVHTGRDITPSDQVAMDARKEAMDMLREICPKGNLEVLDPTTGAPQTRASAYTSNVVHKRVESDIFGMSDYTDSEIDEVETGDEWEP